MAAFPLFQVEIACRGQFSRSVCGPGCTHLNPPGESVDLVFVESATRRHQYRLSLNAMNQGTLLGLPRNNGGPGLSALESGLSAVQPKPRKGRGHLRAMAGIAVIDEQRTNFLFEELELASCRRTLRCPGGKATYKSDECHAGRW